MSSLSNLCTRLSQQFMDAAKLALPLGAQEEAVRSALAKLNAYLGSAYHVLGLDGASSSDLPQAAEAVLLDGAAAFALDFTLRKHLSSFPLTEERSALLLAWCEQLNRQYDEGLERLRLETLQAEAGLPHAEWRWGEDKAWKADRI